MERGAANPKAAPHRPANAEGAGPSVEYDPIESYTFRQRAISPVKVKRTIGIPICLQAVRR